MKAMDFLSIMAVALSAHTLAAEEAEVVPEATTSDVIVEKITFHDWKDAWRVRNKSCELVVVPQISRVMHFGLRDGENLIWVADKAKGQVYDKAGGWHNLGGDKIWPEPQDKFGWPPPYFFDNAPSIAEPLKGGVRLKTKSVAPKYGCVLIREFTLDTEKPRVSIKQRFEKSEGEPVELTLWTVTQVRKPSFALLPLGAETETKQNYRPLNSSPAGEPPFFNVHETVFSLRYNEKKAQKIGISANAELNNDWVAAVYPNCIFVETRKLEKDAKYPDSNCHAEVFVATPELGPYVELELLSPLKTIKAGEKLEDDCVWQIVPLNEAQAENPEAAATAAREAHATTMSDY
jgi:hypothetical protein